MNQRMKVLDLAEKPEDRIVISKLLDKIQQAEKYHKPTYTHFLDPHQQLVANKALNYCHVANYLSYGGYNDAERKIIIVSSDEIEIQNQDGLYTYFKNEGMDVPFVLIKATAKGGDDLTHRDWLGALMGAGIKRETVGDIVVSQNEAFIFVMKEIEDYLSYNLQKTGRYHIGIENMGAFDIEPAQKETREIKATVASLRLDCVAGVCYSISRSSAADLIKGEKLSVNWDCVTNTSRLLKEGDVLSLKGKGRAVLKNVGRITSKGRISIVIEKLK